MSIVLIFFRPISLASRRGYRKMMQVQMVRVCVYSDAGPQMVR